MFSLMTNNMEERLSLIKNSMSKEIALEELNKCTSLEDFYGYSEKVRNGVISQMQIYVLENYKKLPLSVWNDSNFKIVTHISREELRFGKKDTFSSAWKIESFAKVAKKMWEESLKIEQIDFILDEHDGDFSVTFNKNLWSFIWDNNILDYYYTIKNYLNEV